jgi:hypothetical protein
VDCSEHSVIHFSYNMPSTGSFLPVLLLLMCILQYGGLVAATTIGPLGSSPGEPTGSLPIGKSPTSTAITTATATTTATTIVAEDSQFSPGVQALDTTLALLCGILTSTTYAILIGPGTRLLSTSKLPLASIAENIGSLLSRTWPDKSSTTEVSVTQPAANDVSVDSIRLMNVGHMDKETQRAARGVEECHAKPDARIATPPMWLTTGSSLTKSMVQLAVWEWVCCWLVLGMLVSTLSYNGLLTHDRSPDSYPRLVVIMMYTAAFSVHSWYVWSKFKSFFTLVVAGASWSLLHKASFASVDLSQLAARLDGGDDAPVFKQVGKPANSATFPIFPATLVHDVGNIAAAESEDLTDTQKSEAVTVGDWQKRDVTSTVESARTALDSVIVNVMTMLGIIITSGFSVWTSKATAATSQLGSLALLASLTLASAAMFSSAVDLSIMDTSFRNVLFLKEVMINGEASAHVQKRSSRRKVLGFMHKTVQTRTMKITDLVKLTGFWPLLLFGPAYALLPSIADHERQSAGLQYEMNVNVRGKSVLFTTESTDRHNKKADGSSLGAINVCYGIEPPEKTAAELPRRRFNTIWRRIRGKEAITKEED